MMKALSTIFLCLLSAVSTTAQESGSPDSWMCTPGKLIFAEDFDPETVSERWWFKGDFALRDNALLRTDINPTETKRVFLKDPTFHNTIIQFDFKLSGKTTDLRLVTGSGGGYNSVTQIHAEHFQLNTPVDRDAGFVPSHLGECARQPRPDQWQTMTVEYWGDEIVAHLSDQEFVIGSHPIVDRTRKYFAFQFDLPGASIDNVRVWNASSQRENWSDSRKKLVGIQSDREPVARNPADRYRIALINLKSRLTLHDQDYRDLVSNHEKLEAALHADYPEAFTTHKALTKQIAKRKKELREANPEFKRMEATVNKARRAEDAFVLSTQPDLANLKAKGVAKQRFVSELGQVRARLESVGDPQLADLVAETRRRQSELEASFPSAFEKVDAAVEERQTKRKALNKDPEFQNRNRAIVEAGKAIKEYEYKASASLMQLETEAKEASI